MSRFPAYVHVTISHVKKQPDDTRNILAFFAFHAEKCHES